MPMQMNLIAQGLKYGHNYTKEALLQIILNQCFGQTPAQYQGEHLKKFRLVRSHKVNQYFDRLIKSGEVEAVGNERWRRKQTGVPMANFWLNGEWHVVPAHELDAYRAELRAQNPEEQRKRATERKVADLERQITELKENTR